MNRRVSIVIATYNRESLVGRAVESALQQSYPEVEVVVVDDGSTDRTYDVIAGIAARSARHIEYLFKENGGCASARNVGAAHATGRWLMFLDSDDELEVTAVETLVHTLTDSGANFAYAPALEIDIYGGVHLNPPVAAGRPERLAAEHFSRTNIRTGSYLLSTDRFRELGGFDETFSHNEDSDFIQRLTIQSRAAYSPVPAVRCYTHAGSKSRDRVAIYRALLASSERMLTSYPDFAAALGTRASERIAELRCSLAEALIMAGRLDEARAVIAQARCRIRLSGRLALWVGSALPLRARVRWPAHVHGAMAAARHLIGRSRTRTSGKL